MINLCRPSSRLLSEEFCSEKEEEEVIRSAVEGMVTVHHAHMPEVEVLSATEARGIWPMSDVVRHYVDGTLVLRLEGSGHYWETYECIDGIWMIKSSRLTRLRVDLWRAS